MAACRSGWPDGMGSHAEARRSRITREERDGDVECAKAGDAREVGPDAREPRRVVAGDVAAQDEVGHRRRRRLPRRRRRWEGRRRARRRRRRRRERRRGGRQCRRRGRGRRRPRGQGGRHGCDGGWRQAWRRSGRRGGRASRGGGRRHGGGHGRAARATDAGKSREDAEVRERVAPARVAHLLASHRRSGFGVVGWWPFGGSLY